MSVAGDVSVAWHIWRGCVYRIFEALGCGEWPMTDTEELGPHNRGPCGPAEVPATEGLMLRRRMRGWISASYSHVRTEKYER